MNFSRRFAMLLAWVGLSSWCFGAVELKEAEITTIKNIVEKDEGGGAQPAKTNDKIYEKAKVTTAAASMAELTFVDSSITRMGANTLFSFQSKERLIKLDQGTVLIHTPPGNGGATVDCGGVTASVTGTTFMASRDKVGNSVFVLLEGAGGMKITVGGTSTTIRPGQAASVGASVASDAGGKTEDKATTGTKVDATGGGKEAGQGKEQEATGKPNPDTSGTGGGKAGGETSGGAGTLPPGNTGGGDAGAGSKSTPSAVAQTPAAAPAPLKTPEIKVFEVDVKKVVQTTPLITGFKTELPSAKKIEATIQVQQAKVAEGKIEKLEVEVVAVSHADGDLLVGAPQVEKEDMKIVNSKETVAEKVDSKMAENTPGKGPAGDGLDIATAAGPESGGNNTAVTTARSPKVETPGPQPTATTPPPINPGQTVVQQPAPTAPIAVTARVDDASRFYNQANPAFGFSITSGSLLPGHSLVGNFLTAATTSSGVTGSPYAISLSNTKIVNSAGEEVTSRYNLTTVAGVLNVLKAAQSVAFDSIGSLTFRQEANLVAKALAGEVKVEVVSGPATVTNGKLVANSGTGTVVIRATTSGNDNYNGAFAEQTITLAKAGQSVNFALPTSLTFDQATALGATATGAGSVTYELVNAGDSSKVSISGGQLKALSGTGTVQIRAVTAGDNNYNGAFAEQMITLAKAGQSVNFALPSTPLTYNTGTGLTASALDSGTVSFQVLVGPGTIDGSGRLVATSGTGSVVVRATAAGDQNYIPAFADQTITLAKAGQSVSFALPANLTFDQATTLGATATGAGSVSYELVNAADSSKVSISGGQIKALSGTGTVQIRAVTAGDNNYDVASAIQTIALTKAVQNLGFSASTPLLTGNSRLIPVLGAQTGSPVYSIVERDGRASVDSVGNVSVGKILGADSFTLRADAAGDNNYLAGQKDFTVNISRNIPAVEAANATRQFLILPDATDLAAFDEFFYFTGRASGTTAGPSAFFANSGIGDTDRTLAAPGSSIQLYSGQNWDLFAARKFTASPGSITISPSAGKTETAYYGTTIDLGAANPVWQGTQDPRNSSTSLGFRYLTLNSDYLPVFDETLAGAEPTGFFDSYGALLSPLENFPVWDDVGDLNGAISSADIVSVTLSSGSANWSLVGGTGGITARGLDVVANGSAVQMMTSGDLNLKTTRIAGVSRPDLTQSSHPDLSGENLVLEAKGKVKMGVDATLNLDLPTFAGLPEQQQVRLEAKTDPSGNPLAGNLAVVRTGDSLELRNVTIRGFAETRLEKWNPDTKAVEGRVLISGSAVRDFKIKELVGAAVNADSKIQMMALDANGALAGDMVVGGDDARNRNRLPVKAKIASALAEVGENLPTATAGAMVDAKQIDLAAGNLKFQNANLVAMNAITARANTILVQNSFMTVVRNQGMINMYVQSGLVNQNYGAMVDGRVNFAGLNKFTIGNTVIPIGNQGELTAAYGNALVDINFNNGVPQAGKVNVLKL